MSNKSDLATRADHILRFLEDFRLLVGNKGKTKVVQYSFSKFKLPTK